MWYTWNILTVRMSDNLPERVQILGHAHIICITAGLTELSAVKYFAICSWNLLLSGFLMLCSWF